MFLQSLKNFVTGHGWQDNASRARQDEEERRRRQQQAVVSTPRTPATPVSPRPTPSLLSPAPRQDLLNPTQPNNLLTPQTPRPAVQINDFSQAPKAVKPPSVANPVSPQMSYDTSGLSPERRALVADLVRRGKDPSAVILSGRAAAEAKAKADFLNNPFGRVVGTLGTMGSIIGGTAADTGSRVLEGISLFGNQVFGGKDKVQRGRDIMDAGERARNDIQQIRDRISFVDPTAERGETEKQETDREAQAISTGQATPSDIFSAVLKSADLASFVPTSKVLQAVGLTRRATPSSVRVSSPTKVRPTSDPNSPISVNRTPTVEERPAITSPNRTRPNEPVPTRPRTPDVPTNPTVLPDAPVVAPRPLEPTTPPKPREVPPNRLDTNPDTIDTPQVPKRIQPEPKSPELVAREKEVQKALDSETVKPAKQPELPTSEQVESPTTTKSRQVAQEATPVDQTSIRSSEATKARSEAPTEAIAKGEGKVGAVKESDGVGQLADDIPFATKGNASSSKTENYLQRTVSADSSPKDVKAALARRSGADAEADLSEILDEMTKLTPRMRKQIERDFKVIEDNSAGINRIQDSFRGTVSTSNPMGGQSLKDIKKNAHLRNKHTQNMQLAEKRIQNVLQRLDSRQSLKSRALNAGSNLVAYQQGNMLSSVSVQEKNVIGDIVATATMASRHPIKTIKNIPEARLGSEMKKAVREATQVLPQTMSQTPKWLIRSVLSPVYAVNNALANVRGGVLRTTAARSELIRAGVKSPTRAQIQAQALRAGNAREIMINLQKGVGSTIADPYKAARASDEWFKVLDNSTSHKDLKRFADETQKSSGILQELMSGKNKDGRVTPMSLLINAIYPFTNPAINASKKAIYMLDPRKASQVNTLKKIIQSPTKNNLDKLAKMAGTGASIYALAELANSGVLAYNDESTSGDVSKPNGWFIKTGENTYMPARAFGTFEPFIVAVGTTYAVMNGDVKSGGEAWGMLANSLPIASSNEFYKGAAGEWGDGEFWGYNTQAQAVNRTKNLVPLVNNSVGQFADRLRGKSSDAFTTYASKKDADGKSSPDFWKWTSNQIKQGFGNTEGLKPSLTPAGQRRTRDNQGAFINKSINDKNTKTYNDAISDLMKYARENNLSDTAQDMFNTYPNGKNSDFKSIVDAITFLDVEEGKSPDNTKKLESNPKLQDLASQIRNGFFGDGGSDLLTLDGVELKSDVSLPGKYGGKNSKLPISMGSIINAVAQTDLPADQRDALYTISQEKSGLYDRRKAGEFNYKQEQEMRRELGRKETAILQNSASYKKLEKLMTKLDNDGFFDEGGFGSTKSGQTFLWNSINAMLGDKGATPATNYPDNTSSGGSGRRSGSSGSKGRASTVVQVKGGVKLTDFDKPTETFKPIPDLKVGKAPRTVAKKAISVKRGVHL